MPLYWRLLRYVRPYRGRVAAALACLASNAGLTAAGMYLIKPVMDKVLTNPDHAQALVYLKLVPLAIVLTYLLKGLAVYGQDYLINNLGNRIILDVRNQLYTHLLDLDLSFFSGQRTGLLISRITHDVSQMQAAVSNVLGQLLGSVLTILGLLGLLFFLDWKLALISLFVFPVAVYPVIAIGKVLRRISRDSQAKMADLTTVLHESLAGIRVVKAFTMENQEVQRFHQELRRYFDLTMRALRKTALSSPLMEFIGSLGIGFMILWAGSQVIQGSYTSGTFFAFLGGLASLYPQVKTLSGVNNTIQQALAAAQRVFELLDTPPAVQDRPGARVLKGVRQGVVFEHVSFEYQPDRPVLKDVSFQIKAGQVLAIVGRSGAGKTTLVDLIPRFADVTAGAITLDGHDLRDLTLSSLRGCLGLVTQETILFNDTIRNNIAYGRPGATADEVTAAARNANAHEFILQTKHGYDTVIGERGVRLSGGQRQRLAIARAILKNPPLLILDEATSALDTESEQLVQDALNRLMSHRTTFVIAHRLSTIRDCEEIIVLHQGKVAERGTHEELLGLGGRYAGLIVN